jgi:hypothetical protein
MPTSPVRSALLLLAGLAALLLLPAAAQAGADMPAPPWPPPSVAYREVRAYYDPSSYNGRDLLTNAPLPYDKGIRLTQKQTQKLLAAVQGTHPAYTSPMCIEPRHAFVFYDALHKPVALIEPCLECLVMIQQPGGSGSPVDYPALAELIHALGFPLSPTGMTLQKFRASFAESVQRAAHP